ncbi:MAG TPA: CocE/NonD family hydrolase, partial [Candidatus Thermoplasmatota archaeon]|nr:CocE/NonD family hydrolase [Candidatus Thermoplasmatota archaeon]
MRALLSVLLATVLLGGCFGADQAAPTAAPPEPIDLPVAQRPVTSAALSTYLGGLSEPLEGISFATAIVEQYRTPITELVELDTWIARPPVDAKVPIILDVTPYYGGGAPTGLGRVGTELIQRGYAVGVSSVRGTGQSGGCFTQGGPSEGPDTAAVIEHLASQEWSNGNVGLMGV